MKEWIKDEGRNDCRLCETEKRDSSNAIYAVIVKTRMTTEQRHSSDFSCFTWCVPPTLLQAEIMSQSSHKIYSGRECTPRHWVVVRLIARNLQAHSGKQRTTHSMRFSKHLFGVKFILCSCLCNIWKHTFVLYAPVIVVFKKNWNILCVFEA